TSPDATEHSGQNAACKNAANLLPTAHRKVHAADHDSIFAATNRNCGVRNVPSRRWRFSRVK
ncbi:MAG TPA: hypothetical protein VGJ91_22255, partial [Polyangiaceae bacterium]